MKNISLYILVFMCLFSATSAMAGGRKPYKGKMNIVPMQLEQIGDSLYIDIDFDVEGVRVRTSRSISLIPVLVGPDVEKRLPEVMVKGRENYFTSQREFALMSKSQRQLYEQNPPYGILKGYKSKDPKQLQYRKAIAFEPWMAHARLDMEEDLCGCGLPPRSLTVSQLAHQVQLDLPVSVYEVTPYLSYVRGEATTVGNKRQTVEGFLDFIVSKTDIRPNYMNNPRELKNITDLIKSVRKDTNVVVKSISVVGYASPEGTLEFNQYLSEGRAKALAGYLQPRFEYPRSIYNIEFGGENWNGLFDLVTSSHMEHKNQVLAILSNRDIDDQARKQQLKELADKTPYSYMLKEYYPSLRKAVCKIDYEVKGFDLKRDKSRIKTHPKELSLNEMYLIANTYEVGSPEFIEVFQIAASHFPDDKTANLNAAAAALERKDTQLAEHHLGKVKARVHIAEHDNALGVLELLKGNYDKAEGYLKSAADAGLERAKQNLIELQKKVENEKLIKTKERRK